MNLYLLLISLATLVLVCRSEWSKPIPLYDKTYMSFSSGLTILNSTRDSIIPLSTILRTKPSKTAHYSYLIHSNTLNFFQLIDNKHGCVYGIFMNAIKDEFYTACIGTRIAGKSTAECDDSVKTGCSEVLFMELKGKEWSEPRVVYRKDMNDVVHRSGVSMIQSLTSGRLFMFYSNNEVFGKSYISFVSRPANSDVFSREMNIAEVKGQLKDRSVVSAITTTSTGQLIHVAWNENGNLYYLFSTNNGIRWERKQLISTITSISQELPSLQFLAYKTKPEFIFLLYVTKEHIAELRWEKNGFLTTHSSKQVIGKGLQYVNGALCETTDKVVIIGRTIDMTLQGFMFDIQKATIKQIDPPFNGEFMYEFPQVLCETKQDLLTVKVVAHNQREKIEYLTIADIHL